jgi:AcrR family transcriptional regulator
MKDRKQTEEEIVSAVDRIIKREGFTALGINAIAKEAGVSKVLIYRYFDDFDGLIRRWTESTTYWNEQIQGVDMNQSPSKIVESVLKGYTRSLRQDVTRREMLRWLLAEESKTGALIMEKMEKDGRELTDLYKENVKSEGDINALFAILTAGISYLTLMEDRAELFNGINIRSEEGWERLDRVIGLILESLL